MMGQSDRRTLCDNLNHRRTQPSMRHCPTCGDVVNAKLAVQRCSETQHNATRRDRSVFCGECGTRLIEDG